MSLRWRVTLAVLVTCSLVLGGVGMLMHARWAADLAADQEHQTAATLERLAASLRLPAWEADLDLTHDLVLAEMHGNRHLSGLTVHLHAPIDTTVTLHRDAAWQPLAAAAGSAPREATGTHRQTVRHQGQDLATITAHSTDRFLVQARRERAYEQVFEILILDLVLVILIIVLLNRVVVDQLAGVSQAIAAAPDIDLPAQPRRDPLSAIAGNAEALLVRLQTIIDAIDEALIVTDDTLRVQRANPAARNLLGLDAANGRGRSLADILPADLDGAAIAATVHAQVIGARATYRSDTPVRTACADSTRQLTLAASPILRGGRVEGVVVILHDLTTLRDLEEELHQARKLESIGQLAGGIAHDFNNMLAAISGSAELIGMHPDDDARRQRYLDTILTTAHQAADLNHKLLAFARKGPIRRAPTAVATLIDQAAEMLRHSVDRRIAIAVEQAEEAVCVDADAPSLVNAILNLGINARDAMPDGGELRIAAALRHLDAAAAAGIQGDLAAGRYVEITVCDTGSGIPPEVLSRIFDPFFTTKPVGAGTGLGLSATYGTVRAHDGAIDVTSTPQRGTRFRILLPALPEARPQARQPTPMPLGAGARILVVDDDDAVRATIADLLAGLEYTPITVADGAAALRAITDDGAFDAVLLDLMMPAPNGEETYVRLRATAPTLPVVLMSGFAEHADFDRERLAGASGPVSKPFAVDDLAAALNAARAAVDARAG